MPILDNVPLKKVKKNRDYLVILPEKGAFPGWDVSGIVVARFGFKASWPFCEKDEHYFLVVKVYSGEAKVEQLLTLQADFQKFDIEDRSGFMVVEYSDEKDDTEEISPLSIAIATVISILIVS